MTYKAYVAVIVGGIRKGTATLTEKALDTLQIRETMHAAVCLSKHNVSIYGYLEFSNFSTC